ncbi:hypothetical protein U1Q18_040851, partial [Sarracenia purpurea var. burkii]
FPTSEERNRTPWVRGETGGKRLWLRQLFHCPLFSFLIHFNSSFVHSKEFDSHFLGSLTLTAEQD